MFLVLNILLLQHFKAKRAHVVWTYFENLLSCKRQIVHKMSLYFLFCQLVFRNFRPLKKTIPVKQEPSYEVLDGGKLIVIRMVVTCRSQPVLQWMHGTRSVAVIGRYKQEIVKEGDGYAIVLKIDQVGLISMMSSHTVFIYVYLQPHPTPEIYCRTFFRSILMYLVFSFKTFYCYENLC